MTLNRSIVVALLLVCACLITNARADSTAQTTKRVVVGYFMHGADMRFEDCQNYSPLMINSTYTHIVYSPLVMDSVEFSVNVIALPDLDTLSDLKELRSSHTDLKLMLSVGSTRVSTYAWSNMVRDQAYRTAFISSLVNFTRAQDFDGVDLDWETVGREDENGRPTDMANYGVLLQELREAIDAETVPSGKSKLVFSVTIPGGPKIDAYNGTKIAENADWINVKTFNLISENPVVTAHHTQLKGNAENNMTVDWTVSRLLSQGVSRKKIVMGLASFGTGFLLENSANNGVGDPVYGLQSGVCSDGEFPGAVPYFEIADNLKAGRWMSHFDNNTDCKYAGMNSMWISYDDNTTISAKVDYILEKQLLGAFVWSLDQDLVSEDNLASIPISRILPNSDGFDDEESAAASTLPFVSLLLVALVALMFLLS